MRAVTFSQTGAAGSVLTLIDKPLRDPGPGEVRVRMHRSGVNPTDWKTRSAQPGTPVDPPKVPDHDGAGVVDAVGEGVGPGLLGLRVWTREAAHGRTEGTAQEYALLPVHLISTLPDAASFDLGAGLGVPFVTAHRCLTINEHGPSRLGPGALDGHVVLVSGGAGAVGNAAIQLARWSDATVITTVSSPAKAQLAGAAGADHIVDYTQEDVATHVRRIAPRGVHSIVEVAAAANGALDADVLAQGGSIAAYAGADGEMTTLPVRRLMMLNARCQFVLLYSEPEIAKGHAVDDITAAILDGAIGIGVDHGLPVHHFPLAETAAAHAAVEAGTVGKVLIDIDD